MPAEQLPTDRRGRPVVLTVGHPAARDPERRWRRTIGSVGLALAALLVAAGSLAAVGAWVLTGGSTSGRTTTPIWEAPRIVDVAVDVPAEPSSAPSPVVEASRHAAETGSVVATTTAEADSEDRSGPSGDDRSGTSSDDRSGTSGDDRSGRSGDDPVGTTRATASAPAGGGTAGKSGTAGNGATGSDDSDPSGSGSSGPGAGASDAGSGDAGSDDSGSGNSGSGNSGSGNSGSGNSGSGNSGSGHDGTSGKGDG